MRAHLLLPRRASTAALVALLLLGSAACSSDEGAGPSTGPSTTQTDRSSTTVAGEDDGDDGDDEARAEELAAATEEDYVEALAANFGRSGDVFSEEGVTCLAGRWVEAIGTETFRDAGIAPGDLAANQARFEELELDRTTAEALADGFDACGLAIRDAYLRTLQGDLSEQGKICVEELLTEDAVRRSFVADLLGEELDPDPLTQVDRCTR